MSENLSTDVIIDSSEPPEIFDETVYQLNSNIKYKHLTYKRADLVCGDFKFNSFGAERKRIDDFIASIHDGRIVGQAFKMFSNYDIRYLLVEGLVDDSFEEKDLKAIYTTIADLQQRYNFIVMFFPNQTVLIHYFLMMCNKLTKQLKPLYVFRSHLPTIEDEQIEILCGIYGLGKKKAINLLTTFLTIQNVFKAEIKDLIQIKGIGTKIATHIYEISNKLFKIENVGAIDE